MQAKVYCVLPPAYSKRSQVLHYVCGTHNTPDALEMLNMCITGLPDDDADTTKNLDVNSALKMKDAKGRIPLHYAAFRGNADVIAKILERKLGPSCSSLTTDDVGDSPMHYVTSVCPNNPNVFRTLRDLGFDSEMDNHTTLPTEQMISGCVRLIKRFGGGYDIENDDGVSPIMHACEIGNLPVVRTMLSEQCVTHRQTAREPQQPARSAGAGEEDVACERNCRVRAK